MVKHIFDIELLTIGVILLLFFLGICGLWVMNDFAGCMYNANKLNLNLDCYVTNGYRTLDGVKAFHVGLYTTMIALFALTLISLYKLIKK